MEKTPKVGKEFPLDAKIIEAQTRNTVEKTRAILATTVLVASVGALAIAGLVVAMTRDMSFLPSVWSVVAMPLGAVIGHYFGKAQSNDKNDDQSST